MNCFDVSAVVVSRGDLTIESWDSILYPLERCFKAVIVWNNAKSVVDLKTFGLYLGIDKAETPLVYTQDDDCIVEQPELLFAAWKPGRIVCNMPEEFQTVYQDKPDRLMGFGCLFERSLIRKTFERYFRYYPLDELLLREANRIFTGLNLSIVDMVAVPKTNMPYCSDSNRLWKQADHGEKRDESYLRISHILSQEQNVA